jgi:hypothetical protein
MQLDSPSKQGTTCSIYTGATMRHSSEAERVIGLATHHHKGTLTSTIRKCQWLKQLYPQRREGIIAV